MKNLYLWGKCFAGTVFFCNFEIRNLTNCKKSPNWREEVRGKLTIPRHRNAGIEAPYIFIKHVPADDL